MQRIAFALVGALMALAFATSSHATLNACSAAKKKCVAKKAAALLKCHSKNEKPPTGLTPAQFAACIQKANDKFDGGADPTKGCFAKLEIKFSGGCLTINDTVALEAKVDAFVDDVVCELDAGSGTCPATPTPAATPTPTPTLPPTPTATPTGCLPNGGSCVANNQCCSLHCMFGVCQLPSCSDGIKNGNETDVDCGGTCPPCGTGQGCGVGADCTSGVCSGGTCQAPSCSDGIKNGNETDVDCGGGTCPTCGTGQGCGVGADCTSGICSGNVCN